MPRAAMRFWVLAALFLALNAAGLVWIRHSLVRLHTPLLRVVSVTPTSLEAADRISVQFHEPIVGEDQAGERASAPLFSLKPEPAGHWEWGARDRLDFVLAQKLPPGRVYRLVPTADAERRTGRTLYGSAEFELQTAPLRLKACRVHSVDRDAATIELLFNQPVSPDEVVKHLTVTAAGAPVVANTLQREPVEAVCVRVLSVETKFQVTLGKDLRGVEGELPLGKPVQETLTVPQRFVALRTDAYAAALSDEATVRIRFSRPLDRKQQAPVVEVTPAVAGVMASVGEQDIVLTGPFRCGVRYTAVVPVDVLSVNGESLGQAQRLEFTVPDRDATLSIPFSNGVLSPSGNLLLDVKGVNVQEVKVRASRLHPNNLVAHMLRSWASETSRELPERSVRLDWARNQVRNAVIDLNPIVQGRRGVYTVSIRSVHDRWVGDESTVAVTDLGISCKRGRDGLLVWATSISEGRPVEGARIAAVSRTNQTLAEGVSDSSGLVHLTIPAKHPDGQPWIVTAMRDDDLSFLRLGDEGEILDDVDQSGRESPGSYDIMLYTDRGVYRPGERGFITGIIREAGGQTPPVFPLTVTVFRPDGRKIAEIPAKPEPGEQGLFHVQFDAPEQGHTGRYRFRAGLPGAAESLGETHAWVEAFVPARIEVQAIPDRDRYGPGERATVAVSARYLFDQPAAGLNVVVRGTHERVAFAAPSYPGYTFGVPEADREAMIADIAGALDSTGKASFTIPEPPSARRGVWRTRISATVTETGGRSVSANTVFAADTAGRHLGLLLPSQVLPAGDEVPLRWAVVTGLGTPAEPAPLTFRLVRVEGDSTIEVFNGRPVWKWTEREVAVKEWKIEGAATGQTSVMCAEVGAYRVYAVDAQGAAARLEFVSGGEGASPSGRPERIELALDKPRYRPGETATVAIRAPFAGSALITLETNKVLSSQVVDMASGSTQIQVSVPSSLRGGAFLSAAVVRGVNTTGEKWLPTRAAGLVRLVTDHADLSLPVAIEAPAELRPGATAAVTVRTAPPSDPARPGMVHIWAVDDGILMSAAYKKPDPLGHFLGKRRLGVESEDLYRRFMPDHRRPAGIDRIGGDGGDEEDEAYTRGPAPMRRREPAVVWQAAIPVSSDGVAMIELPMPDMTGRMRIMAVAVDGDRYGSAEAGVVLRSPLMVEASWPRFLAPGDRADVPIKVVNTTASDIEVALDFGVSGPGAWEGDGRGTIRVAAGRSEIMWRTLVASGEGTIEVRARAMAVSGELVSSVMGTVASRFAAGVDTVVAVQRLRSDSPLDVALDDRFIPGSTSMRITIGPGPDVHLGPALDSLIDYPYGCVEQTASRLFALLEVPSLLETDSAQRAAAVETMIAGGIDRLWSMQTPSGGLAYWPGGGEAYPWGTAYAAEFLVRARESGRKVDPGFLSMLADYLVRALRTGGDDVDDNTRAQMCAVLARLDRPQPGWIAALSERMDRLDVSGRAHLARAIAATGQRDAALRLIGDDVLSVAAATTAGGRLTSTVIQQAEVLWTLLDIDPAHALTPLLARKLEASRSNGVWGSTAENAAAVCALARYVRLSAPPRPFAGVLRTASGETRFDSTAPLTARVLGPDAPAAITVEGEGEACVTIVTRGRTTAPLPVFGRGLEISRQWLARDGTPLNPRSIRVGDLVQVRVMLRAAAAGSREISNIAVVDLLPAGFEVENPALATSAGQPADAPRADRVEFRDDRVVVFSSASGTQREFRYFLRAVGAGRFAQAPIQAASMYDAALAAGGGEIEWIEVRK